MQPLKWSKRKTVDFDSSLNEKREAERDSSEDNQNVQSQTPDCYMAESSGTQPMMSDLDDTNDETYPNFNRKL